MDYNITKENTSLVLANYAFVSPQEFLSSVNESPEISQVIKEGGFKKLDVRTNIPIPSESLPILGYQNGNIHIIYSVLDRRLDIKAFNYESNKETLLKLIRMFYSLRTAEIRAVGLNFSTTWNTKNKKLNIFNQNIDKVISDWEKNTTIKVELPFKYNKNDEYIVTYVISKEQGGKLLDGSMQEYQYNINANFNFDISENRTDVVGRYKRLEGIFNGLDNFRTQFMNKCKEIILL